MSKSYNKVPVVNHTPSRLTKRYWKKSDNRKIRRELKSNENSQIGVVKSCHYKRFGDNWYHDVMNKGYCEKEFYETFGGYSKLKRK